MGLLIHFKAPGPKPFPISILDIVREYGGQITVDHERVSKKDYRLWVCIDIQGTKLQPDNVVSAMFQALEKCSDNRECFYGDAPYFECLVEDKAAVKTVQPWCQKFIEDNPGLVTGSVAW